MMRKKSIPLSTQCASLDHEGNAWIFSNEFNGLFFLNTDTYELNYVTKFDEEVFAGDLYNEMLFYKGKLYCFPCVAEKMAVYDISTGKTHYIVLEKRKAVEYYNVTKITETNVLLLPVEIEDHAYILDLETEAYQTIPFDCKKVKQEVNNKILRGKAYLNGKAYYAIDGTNSLLVYSIEENLFYIETQKKPEALFMTFSAEKKMYILQANGSEYDVYDRNGYQETVKLAEELYTESWSVEAMQYIHLWSLEKDVLIGMPMRDHPLYMLCNGESLNMDLEWEQVSIYKSDLQPLHVCKKKKEQLLLFPYHSHTLVLIDLPTMHAEYIDLVVPYEDYLEIYSDAWKKQFEEEQILYESPHCFLDTYLELILQTTISSKSSEDREVGRDIYQILKQQ